MPPKGGPHTPNTFPCCIESRLTLNPFLTFEVIKGYVFLQISKNLKAAGLVYCERMYELARQEAQTFPKTPCY